MTTETEIGKQPDTDKPQRRNGTGSIYWRGNVRWVKYSINGKVYRQSANSDLKWKAVELLKKKLGQSANQTFIEPKFEKTLIRELAKDMLRDYKVNGKRTLTDATIRWTKHLEPVFGQMRAANLRTDRINEYIQDRQKEGAANATINREIAALKRMFSLGVQGMKVARAPYFPHLKENNTRKGFLEDARFDALRAECSKVGLWLRAILETGATFAWRKGELENLKVNQVDLASGIIRLEPGETKNDEGRSAVMPSGVRVLLQACITGKKPDDYVFTRDDGSRIQDFRKTWQAVCCAAGVGRMLCKKCGTPVVKGEPLVCKNGKPGFHKDECPKCKTALSAAEQRYSGLILHDLRRTGVRNMIRAGIPERVAMTISGHKTRSILDRYNIVSPADLKVAARRMEEAAQKRAEDVTLLQKKQSEQVAGHNLGTIDPLQALSPNDRLPC